MSGAIAWLERAIPNQARPRSPTISADSQHVRERLWTFGRFWLGPCGGLQMHKIERYRRNAEACEASAASASDPITQRRWLDLAKEWREMADRLEPIQAIGTDTRSTNFS